MQKSRVPVLLSAFITLLNDRLGETIIFPLLPFLLERFTKSGSTLGLLAGTYAISQFAVAPLIGALSDRFGRKPIMITCVSGSVIGLLLFAITVSIQWKIYLPIWASSIPLIFLFAARVIDGISGGTAATATAVLADISTPENRAKTFGLIGVAFGLGFVLGPGLGTSLSKFSVNLPVWAASGFALINLFLVIWVLPETRPDDASFSTIRKRELNPITKIAEVMSNASCRRLCLAFFVFFMAFNGFTAVLVLYLKESFDWSPQMASQAFIVVGIVAMVVQGGFIGPLVKQFGELKLTLSGTGFVIAGCILLIMANKENSISTVYSSVAILALGTGLVTPCLRSLISRRLASTKQGAVLGSLQGLQSLGTFVGASIAGISYEFLGGKSPFIGTSCLLLIVIALVSNNPLNKDNQLEIQGHKNA